MRKAVLSLVAFSLQSIWLSHGPSMESSPGQGGSGAAIVVGGLSTSSAANERAFTYIEYAAA